MHGDERPLENPIPSKTSEYVLCQVDEGFDQEHIGGEKDGNIGGKTTSGAMQHG